jgi:acetyl esterase/lipase
MLRHSLALIVLLSFVPIAAARPFHDPMFGVQQQFNIVYGTGALANGNTIALTLDLYSPRKIGYGAPPAISPGIVLLHGGAASSQTTSDPFITDLAFKFVTFGYVVASINYRSVQQVQEFPGLPWYEGAAQDAEQALIWMRDNSATFHIDPNRLGLGGVSDGASISLYEAYLDPSHEIVPKVLLDYSGTDLYEQIVNLDGPPAFVTHGEDDYIFPYYFAQETVDNLTSVGIYNEFYLQPDVGHAVDFNAITDGKTLLRHNLDFLERFLVPEPSSLALCGAAILFGVAFRLLRAGRATVV